MNAKFSKPASENVFVRDNLISYHNTEKFIHNLTFESNQRQLLIYFGYNYVIYIVIFVL